MKFLVLPAFSPNQLVRANRIGTANKYVETWMAGGHGARVLNPRSVEEDLTMSFGLELVHQSHRVADTTCRANCEGFCHWRHYARITPSRKPPSHPKY